MMQFSGRLLALPTHIVLEWNDLPGTDTPAYYEHVKKFYKIGPCSAMSSSGIVGTVGSVTENSQSQYFIFDINRRTYTIKHFYIRNYYRIVISVSFSASLLHAGPNVIKLSASVIYDFL